MFGSPLLFKVIWYDSFNGEQTRSDCSQTSCPLLLLISFTITLTTPWCHIISYNYAIIAWQNSTFNNLAIKSLLVTLLHIDKISKIIKYLIACYKVSYMFHTYKYDISLKMPSQLCDHNRVMLKYFFFFVCVSFS